MLLLRSPSLGLWHLNPILTLVAVDLDLVVLEHVAPVEGHVAEVAAVGALLGVLPLDMLLHVRRRGAHVGAELAGLGHDSMHLNIIEHVTKMIMRTLYEKQTSFNVSTPFP